MQEQVVCIVPARLASTRFPNKPFVPIRGIPMLQRVHANAANAASTKKVVIAAYDKQIKDFCEERGIEAQVVNIQCQNGSEAVADVAAMLKEEWIFEMQGDQPMVTPDIIDTFITRAIAEVKKNSAVDVVIPFAPTGEEHRQSPDVLKVITTASNRLLFQTRHPVHTGYRTLGLYLWKREALLRFASLPVSDIERMEESHPIRLYVNDFYVQGLPIAGEAWVEVDREHHVAEVERLMEERGIL